MGVGGVSNELAKGRQKERRDMEIPLPHLAFVL